MYVGEEYGEVVDEIRKEYLIESTASYVPKVV